MERLKEEKMFTNEKEETEMLNLLEEWKTDPQNLKSAFVELREHLTEKEHAILSFNSRPGVSYSLRATVDTHGEKKWPLFVMADIIDDDPENRWLSVCFYGDMIKDPDEEGDLVPEGLLGEDGYCFDLIENDESMISYIEERIDEAYDFVSVGK
jgi:hypothetical protein